MTAMDSFRFLSEHDFYLFPLHSISSLGHCTCYQGLSCTSPGKHPLLRYNWKRVATNKPEYVQRWLEKENINWGVPTGRRSEQTGKFLVVLDMDSPDSELLEVMPKTFSYQTGSENGQHFWFWSKYPISNSVRKIAPHTDVRGVGGYVVIPPSRHLSGRNYTTVSWDEEIADMTRELYSLVFANREKETKTTGKRKRSETPDSFWANESIETIRRKIDSEIVPMGARNTTLHRLLSSDRARGLDREELFRTAQVYRARCENPESISDWELKTLIGSVLRYRQGQTCQIPRTDSYFAWLEARNKEPLSEDKKAPIRLADDSFFSMLKPSPSARTSLSDILRAQEDYARNIHKLQRFVRYSPVALAARLRNMGFYRIRAAYANYWNIDLNGLKELLERVMIETVTLPEEEQVAMSSVNTKPTTEKEPETFKVKIKNKHHPNEDKYTERATFESHAAWTKLLTVCSPEQMEDLLDRKLIIEPEDTDAFMSETIPGDIIGYVHARENEVMYAGRMSVINSEAGCIVGEDLSRHKNTIILSKSDVSIALATGFLEILYRDAKPYGIPEETEVEVRIHRHSDPDKSAEAGPAVPATENVVEAKEDTGA
jgi:putative DNA primase/helicase